MLRRKPSTASDRKKNRSSRMDDLSGRKKKKKRTKKDRRDKTVNTRDDDEDPNFSRQQSVMQKPKDNKAEIIRPFLESTLKKSVLGLIDEFRKMKRTNDYTKMVEFVAQNAQNRNRYKDVGCLDNSRVILNCGGQPYIHANYASTPNNPKRFICTQGPLPNTCTDFWYMVVQEKSQAILMLCNFVEKGAKKCHPYFPEAAGATVEFADGDITVVSRSCDQHVFKPKSATKLMISQLEVRIRGMETHTCTHYHWLDWPDRGVPEADFSPITLLGFIRECSTPVVVHCSAGIGRTGAIVLIQHVLELVLNNTTLGEMKEYLTNLRTQRNNSVQTEHQYLYVHQILLIYFKRMGWIESKYFEALKDFTAKYNKATAGMG